MKPSFANQVSESRTASRCPSGQTLGKCSKGQGLNFFNLELLQQSLQICWAEMEVSIAAIQACEVIEPVLQLRQGHRQAQRF